VNRQHQEDSFALARIVTRFCRLGNLLRQTMLFVELRESSRGKLRDRAFEYPWSNCPDHRFFQEDFDRLVPAAAKLQAGAPEGFHAPIDEFFYGRRSLLSTSQFFAVLPNHEMQALIASIEAKFVVVVQGYSSQWNLR
jgi:hypothetical protein